MFLDPFQAVAELFTQAIFYGLYIPTFVTCIRWLLFENDGSKLRHYKEMTWPYIIIANVIFVIATVDIVIAFLLTRVRMIRGQELFAAYLSFISVAIEGVALIIIDGVLIYRCWVVYNKSWRVVILPLVFWACTVACSITWTTSNAVGLTLINSTTGLIISVAVFYGCNFATNVYATTAIVYRVWKTAMTNNKTSRLYEVCRTISGTGILYSCTSFFTLVATFAAFRTPFPLAIFNSINFPTACIAYNLVIIRVGQLRAGPLTTSSGVIVFNSTGPPAYVATGAVDSSTDLPK